MNHRRPSPIGVRKTHWVVAYVGVKCEVSRLQYATSDTRGLYTVSNTGQIFPKNRIGRLPDARPRVVVPRPEVVKPRLLVQLPRAEEERRPLLVGVLLHPGLPEREVLQVLVELAVEVGDVVRAPDVIRVVEEEVLLERGVAVRV